MGSRTTEFVLGLLGGILGFLSSFIAIIVGGFGGAFGVEGASTVSLLAWIAVLFSIFAITGCALVSHRPKLGGAIMLISAIGGIICISLFYLLPFVLLFIAGLMGLIRKGKK